MGDDDEDEIALKQYREQARGLAAAFRRASPNIIEEIEKIGFTYVVDDADDEIDEEIIEERAARPETDFAIAVVSYLDGDDAPSERVLELWRAETQRETTPLSLWRRYF